MSFSVVLPITHHPNTLSLSSEPSKVSERRAFVPVEGETNRFRPAAEVVDREHVRIGLPLPDNEPAARFQHPVQLAQRLVRIRDLAKCGDETCGVERLG